MQNPIETRTGYGIFVWRRTRQRLAFGRFAILAGFLVWVGLGIIFRPSILTAQKTDRSLREFKAPSPTELYRILSTYQPEQPSNSMEGNRIGEIEKKGLEFLSKLNPDDQEKAFKFVEDHLKRNGVDSPASRALMNQFGVPAELQKSLIDRLKESSRTDEGDIFRDVMRKVQERSAKPVERSQQDRIEQQKIADLERKGRQLLAGLSQEEKQQAWEFAENYLTENGLDSQSSKVLMDQFGVPDELQQKLAREFNERQSSGVDNSFRKMLEQAKQRALSPPNRPSQPRDERPFGVEPASKDQLASEPTKRKPTTDPKSGLDPTDPTQTGSKLTNQNKTPRLNSNPAVLSPELDRSSEQSDSTRIEDRNSTVAEKTREKEQLSPRLAKSKSLQTGSSAKPIASENREDANLEWEKTFQELARRADGLGLENGDAQQDNVGKAADDSQAGMIQALQKLAANGSSSFNKDLANSLGNSLSGTRSEPQNTKERLTARFDRLLVDAAKRSLESNSKSESGLELSESVDSAFDKFLDKYRESVNKNNQKKKEQADSNSLLENWRSAKQKSQLESTTSTNRDRDNEAGVASAHLSQPDEFPDRPISSPSSEVDPPNLWELFSGLPKIEASNIILIAMIGGLVITVVCVMLRRIDNNDAPVSARKFAKQFSRAKFQSPADLVEGVDQFLISKFGSDSKWWNAGHAREVLCTGAPHFNERIGDLIREYVRSRYMRAEVSLSENEQQQYKSTLQELAKLAARPNRDPASETEG